MIPEPVTYFGAILPPGRKCPWCERLIEATEKIVWDPSGESERKAVHVDCFAERERRKEKPPTTGG